jgi:hypothetical protein
MVGVHQLRYFLAFGSDVEAVLGQPDTGICRRPCR